MESRITKNYSGLEHFMGRRWYNKEWKGKCGVAIFCIALRDGWVGSIALSVAASDRIYFGESSKLEIKRVKT
jgi:hypothetical protein